MKAAVAAEFGEERRLMKGSQDVGPIGPELWLSKMSILQGLLR